VAFPEPIVKVLGNDALRYYLLRETVFGQDGNFSREALITRYNADLANGLGNLASRVLTMIETYFQGTVPECEVEDNPLRQNGAHIVDAVGRHFENFHFSEAVQEIWQIISLVDFMLVQQKPWARIREASERSAIGAVLYEAAEALRFVTVLAHPVIPEATEKIWAQLGQPGKLGEVRIDQLQWGGLKPGTKIGKPEAVFPRADKKEANERIEAMEQEIRNPGSTQPTAAATTPASAGGVTGAAAPATGTSEKISIEDFSKVEMRVGLVKSAEKVAGADKLLKVMVDIGDEVRQIVAGIATAYAPEQLVGRKVVIVANLAPRKLRGVESNGMIVAATAPDGKPVLCTFAEDVPAGARLK
ncbi:MAG: methionine--tRNA ligase subunit beta, partial [Candidatus Acidiferrales bacterium]